MEQLAAFFTKLWVLFRPLIIQLLTEGGLLLVKYVIEAVKKVEETIPKATNLEKKEEALAIVTSQLAKKGIKMKDSTINAALEVAVVQSKEDA